MKRFTVAGHRALVTGASSGIGRALALELGRREAALILTARRRERLDALASELESRGVSVDVVSGDLLDDDFRARLAACFSDAERPCDILINNAAFGMNGLFSESEPGRMQDLVQLGLEVPRELTEAFLAARRAEGTAGGLLSVASVAGFVPTPYHALYSATKAALKAYMLSLRAAPENAGVAITTLCPGLTDTEFFEAGRYAETSLVYKTRRMSPTRVAREAVDALEAGRDLIVPGALNRFMLAAAARLPRSWVLRAAGRTMRTD